MTEPQYVVERISPYHADDASEALGIAEAWESSGYEVRVRDLESGQLVSLDELRAIELKVE